jgi:hypothetical protein
MATAKPLFAPRDRHQALRLNLEFGTAKNNGPERPLS